MHTAHASDYIAEAPKQLILISLWSNCNGFREQVCFSTLITPSFAAHHSRRYLDFAFTVRGWRWAGGFTIIPSRKQYRVSNVFFF